MNDQLGVIVTECIVCAGTVAIQTITAKQGVSRTLTMVVPLRCPSCNAPIKTSIDLFLSVDEEDES
jgi:hypothetical protein